MFSRRIFIIFAAALSGILIFTSNASALSMLQQNLVGIDNRFSVVVSDFEPDGLFTKASILSVAELELAEKGVNIVSPASAPPPGTISINIEKQSISDSSEYSYRLDINVYDQKTLDTTFQERKGTIWMIGSIEVRPGEVSFPKNIEIEVKRMLRMFTWDYFKANP